VTHVNRKTTEALHVDLPSRVESLALEFFEEPRIAEGHRVIGTDSVCELRVDADAGIVRAFDPRGEVPTRLVNSSVRQMAAFIAAYQRYGSDVGAARDESEQLDIVGRLRLELTEIDPDAIADPEGWWSVVLEQVDHGLL
jgi:hypothetical protein